MSGNKSVWWMVAIVLAACLLGLGYQHLNRQAGRDSHNPYKYDIEKYRAAGGELAGYRQVDAIELDQSAISALAVDADGRLLLAADNRIDTYDRNGERNASIEIGNTADCIAIAGDGRIFLGVQDHIEVYGKEGEKFESWTSLGENSRILSLAIVGENLYAADYGNRLVWRYALDGTLLGNIEGMQPGGEKPGFVLPSPSFDVARGPDDALWIVNPGKTAVQEYSPKGKLLRSWGKASMGIEGFCGCCNPSQIAIMADGNIVTAEKGLPRVKIYSPDGELRAVVATAKDFDEPVRGGQDKDLIQDVAVNETGEILVLDCKAKKIRFYERKK